MLKPFAFLLFFLPLQCFAQIVIRGNVIDIGDKKPIPNADVFLANTSIGAHTGDDGSFRLDGVKNGNYELIISMVGYVPFHQTFAVNDSSIMFKNIQLQPKMIDLREVKIRPHDDWKRNYEWFKSMFLGNSDNASQCKILNPDIIDLDYDDATGRLTASTNNFIEVENNALGYKLKYLLANFLWDRKRGLMAYNGSVLFQKMTGSQSQTKKWVRNRRNAYLGSSMHFFRSVIADQTRQNGFQIHQLIITPNADRPADSLIKMNLARYKKLAGQSSEWSDSLFYWVEKSQLPIVKQTFIDSALNLNETIKITDHKGLFAFNCDGDGLYIAYSHRKHISAPSFEENRLIDNMATVVAFRDQYTYFDLNGWILNPESAIFTGFWASKRMADLLPIDYEPPAN